MMCNGASRDDVLFHVHASIERVGWAVVPVVSGTVARSWAYTIGLSSGFGHPEFVVVGRRPDSAGLLLNSLGELVRAGESLSPGEWILGPNDKRLELKEVPCGHFKRETFALWVEYYGALGSPPPEPKALEVFPIERGPALDRLFGQRDGRRRLRSTRPTPELDDDTKGEGGFDGERT